MLSQRSNLNHRLAEKMPHKLVRNYRAQSLRDIVQFRPAVGVLIQAYRASLRDQSDYTNNAYRHAWDCFTKLYELSKQDVFRSDLSSGLRQRDFGKLMVATNAQPERFLTQEEKVSRIEAIHEHMRVLGFDVDEFAWCQLAIASGWLSTRSSSLAFLERLERAGVRSTYGTYWAILDQLMQGLRRSPGGTHSNATTPADVVFFLEHMKDAGISPDVKIYTFVYQSLNETGHGGFALKILKLMRQEGVQPSVVTYTSIVESCIRSGNLDQVHHVLKEMSHVGIPRDARFLTAFLKVCVKAADIPRAEELLLNAQAEWSHRTDKSESDRMAIKCMYSFIIAAHAKQKNMERAWDWYQHMRKYDIDVDVIALTPLIVGFVHDGQLERAKKLYEELKTIGAPDLRAHSEMLVAYLKMGEMEEANAILQTLADGDLPMGATVLAQLLQFHISRDAEEAAMTFLSTHQSKYSAEELRTVFLNVVTHLVSLGKTESISTWFKRFYPDATDADVSSSILKWYEETKNAEAGLDFFTAVSPSVLTEDGTIAFVRLHRSEDFDLPPIDSLPVRSSRVHAAYLAVLCFRGRAEQAVDLLSTYALDLDLHGYAELATELRQLGMFENARAIEEHARNAGADVSILGNR
ncbi:hypothetical protein BC832DRAFT_246184 [Gaertneriomyces semiglobifer]|nr:hypothetical protein BC832DRAFT_246184 [Gaertneriomyces semiglobifer]